MPTIQEPRDVIVKVMRASICSSDLHIRNGGVARAKEGVVVGHEFAGEIVEVGSGVKKFAADGGLVKTSAAWLVERAGFPRGYPEDGPARLSTKHALAITNRGSATTSDVVALAREIRAGVRDRFGIDLVAEPVLLGCSLD